MTMQSPDKATLRQRVLAARGALPPSARAAAARTITQRLLRLPELAGAGNVLGYAAFGSEVDLDDFLRHLLATGVGVHLPWVDGHRLGVSAIGDLATDLAPGWRGVREPPPGRRDARQPRLLDAVVAPGVAFDRRGTRLGYGGGHFDRLIGRLRPGVPVIGVAFSMQILDLVPREAHDRTMDVVVTETEVVRGD